MEFERMEVRDAEVSVGSKLGGKNVSYDSCQSEYYRYGGDHQI